MHVTLITQLGKKVASDARQTSKCGSDVRGSLRVGIHVVQIALWSRQQQHFGGHRRLRTNEAFHGEIRDVR